MLQIFRLAPRLPGAFCVIGKLAAAAACNPCNELLANNGTAVYNVTALTAFNITGNGCLLPPMPIFVTLHSPIVLRSLFIH